MPSVEDWRVVECTACEGTGLHSPNGETDHPEYPIDCPVCKGEGTLRIRDEQLEQAGQTVMCVSY